MNSGSKEKKKSTGGTDTRNPRTENSFFIKNAANIITALRIVFSLSMLFFPAFGAYFYIFYSLAGFTDMIDGTVARKTHSVSDFGSKLDSVADTVFVICALVKIIPATEIPAWIYIATGVVALIRVSNIISSVVMRKKLIFLHTVMNKITGLLLFALPFTLPVVDINISGAVVLAVAAFASVQEGHYIRSGLNEKGKTNEKS